MTPSELLAVLVFAVLPGRLATGQAVAVGPSDRLNPAHPHIEVFLEWHVPRIRLFAQPALSGSPVAELNERGLFSNGRLACSWPGGVYDVKNWDEMVLGYADPKATVFIGCRARTPIRSFWYEEYGRHAELYIEVITRTGRIAEARCGERRCYFDLNELPGDPREQDPSYRVTPKGQTGWAWHISGREIARQDRAERAKLRRDGSFQTFLRNVRKCVTSSASPGCVAEFVMDQIYYPEARIGIGYVTPEQFVKAVWGFTDPWGDQPGRHLIDCFLKARGDSTRLVTDDGWVCDVERINGVWKIADFYLGD